jgi:hypothetical protein
MSLKLVDVSGIWAITSQFLSHSEIHDQHTSFAIFHDIVQVISALVRLRRDLIKQTLPHLGASLRRLILLTRTARLQLGAKQASIVANDLPLWIHPDDPLSADMAKRLSRLLQALTTKTVVRSHTSTEAQKAESLAKPFSKHAAYVLKAYIETIPDPLSTFSAKTREELRPGIFSLCEMLSEHSRDALMVSLDSAGQSIMKNLWKEYKRQLYDGRG